MQSQCYLHFSLINIASLYPWSRVITKYNPDFEKPLWPAASCQYGCWAIFSKFPQTPFIDFHRCQLLYFPCRKQRKHDWSDCLQMLFVITSPTHTTQMQMTLYKSRYNFFFLWKKSCIKIPWAVNIEHEPDVVLVTKQTFHSNIWAVDPFPG